MTSIVGIGYSNLIDAATLSGSGWSTAHPITNLQDRRLWTYARTTGTSADIIIDHGSAKTMRIFGLVGQNTGAADTVTVTAGTTSGGIDVYEGSALTCWPFTPLDYDGGHFGVWVVLPQDISARYARIQVAGSGIIRVSRAVCCPALMFDYAPSYGRISDGWRDPNSTVERGDSGADSGWKRREQRQVPYDLSAITPESASLLHEILRTHSIVDEVVHVASSHDRAVQQQFGFLGTLRALGALENPFYGHRGMAVAIDERGGAP